MQTEKLSCPLCNCKSQHWTLLIFCKSAKLPPFLCFSAGCVRSNHLVERGCQSHSVNQSVIIKCQKRQTTHNRGWRCWMFLHWGFLNKVDLVSGWWDVKKVNHHICCYKKPRFTITSILKATWSIKNSFHGWGFIVMQILDESQDRKTFIIIPLV